MPPSTSAPVARTLVANYAKLYGNLSLGSSSNVTATEPLPTICIRNSVKDLLSNAGGISIVIYLAALVQVFNSFFLLLRIFLESKRLSTWNSQVDTEIARIQFS